jgi:hypothetical protein
MAARGQNKMLDYFQPAVFSQALRAPGLAFSHCVIERVSLLSIFSFVQMQ